MATPVDGRRQSRSPASSQARQPPTNSRRTGAIRLRPASDLSTGMDGPWPNASPSRGNPFNTRIRLFRFGSGSGSLRRSLGLRRERYADRSGTGVGSSTEPEMVCAVQRQ